MYKLGLGKLAFIGLIGLGLLASGVAAADVGMGDEASQIQIFCNVSTRVVGLDLDLGIDPLDGTVTYRLARYHANDPSQNYRIEGTTRGGLSSSVKITRASGVLKIDSIGRTGFVQGTSASDLPATSTLSTVLSKVAHQARSPFQMHGLVINGRDHLAGLFGYGYLPQCVIEQ